MGREPSASGAQPATQRNVSAPGRRGESIAKALQEKVLLGVKRVEVIWGETIVYVDPASAHDIIRWLHDDQSQRYDFLSDVTAVEYRDADVPDRGRVAAAVSSLPGAFVRIKAQLPKGTLEIDKRLGHLIRARIGWSASATTCSGSAFAVILIFAGS